MLCMLFRHALEAIVASTDSEQTLDGNGPTTPAEALVADGSGSGTGSMPPAAGGYGVDAERSDLSGWRNAEEAEVCIRNTFIEIRVPPIAEVLVRTKTVPSRERYPEGFALCRRPLVVAQDQAERVEPEFCVFCSRDALKSRFWSQTRMMDDS